MDNKTKKTQEEIIADLEAQLKKAKEEKNEAAKKPSTLKTVATYGVGALLIGAAAGVGYYFGSLEASDTTTVIPSSGN